RLGLLVLQNGVVQRLPARPGRASFRVLLRRLADVPPAGPGPGPDLATGPGEVAPPPRPRGPDGVVPDLPAGRGRGRPPRGPAERHQVLAIEIVDPRELELPDVGYLTLVDAETGRVRDVPTGRRSLRDRYAAAATEQRDEIDRTIRKAGADHLVMRTDRDW